MKQKAPSVVFARASSMQLDDTCRIRFFKQSGQQHISKQTDTLTHT